MLKSIVVGFVGNRQLKRLDEKSDDRIFNVKNKPILELRLWIGVITTFILGVWLLFKSIFHVRIARKLSDS